MELAFAVDLQASEDGAWPEFSGHLGRVNTIIGANGSGKSQLLIKLKEHTESILGAEYLPVYFEGGRSTQQPSTIPLNGQAILELNRDLDFYNSQYQDSRKNYLSARVLQAFMLMRASEFDIAPAHSKACIEWDRNNRIGPLPEPGQRAVDKFAESFSLIFPELKLIVSAQGHFQIQKRDKLYPTDNLSTGEKQIFSLLADFSILSSEKHVFYVDEPELNLHSELANRFWTFVEEQFPKSVFVYCTHDIAFCLRDSVDKIFAIGHGEIHRSELSRTLDIRPFLGALPGVLRSKKCLLVEGTEHSFDASFYQWLLNRKDILIIPVGSCGDVLSAVRRQGLWNEISSGITLAGVIDRDFQTHQFFNEPIVQLDLHEAESYLCHPDVGLELYQHLGMGNNALTLSDIETIIIEHAKKSLIATVLRRTATLCSTNLRASIGNVHNTRDITTEEAIQHLCNAATLESKKGVALFDSENVRRAFLEQLAECSKPVDERDILKILQLFEGKQLLPSIARKCSTGTPSNFRRAIFKHFNAQNFDHLANLKNKLQESLSS